MNVLVTGGCGFIGSAMVRALLKNQATGAVVNPDLLTYCGNQANTENASQDPRYHFVQGDIADKKLVTREAVAQRAAPLGAGRCAQYLKNLATDGAK